MIGLGEPDSGDGITDFAGCNYNGTAAVVVAVAVDVGDGLVHRFPNTLKKYS